METAITFLNLSGDITIVWDDQNKEKLIELVRQKMKEGYTFFTTKRVLIDRFKRRVKVTEKTVETIEELIISDEQFEKMVEEMNDRDVASLVRAKQASIGKRRGQSDMGAMERIRKPEDAVGKQSLAVRPIAGG